MRSSDSLAWCYNILSYNLLINILALKCDMKSKEIVYNSVDCHIYKSHIEQIKEQLSRLPRPFPHIKLNSSLKNKEWSEMEYSDFELIGYFSHPSIKMSMAI
jgi:thymidylate synthase